MKTALKKPQFLFVIFCFSLFLFAVPVFAQAPWNAFYQSQFSLKTLSYGAICEIVGCGLGEEYAKPTANNENPTTPKITFQQPGKVGGLLGFTGNTMIAMYDNPPTSTTYYLANVGREFGIVPPAYAQVTGSGANMIKPVEQLWQILRNVSYLFFIIIFVAIGFMIMLRQKLNAQTVISVQSALPGLVIGLILVTFSYFLAALMTDLAFFGVQLVAQIFLSIVKDTATGKEVINIFDPQVLANKSSIFDLYSESLKSASWAIANPGNYYQTIGSIAGSANSATAVGALLGGALFAVIGGLPIMGGAVLAGAALPLLAYLILLIAFTVQILKLTYKLLMAYVMILLNTAIGPLYITFSVLPGRGNLVGMWWKNILGNALVFPAVFGVFLFAGMIMKTDATQWASTPPFFGGMSTQLLQPLIAFVILLGTPAVPDMVKKAVGASDFGTIGQTGMAGFMGGFGILQKGYGKYMEPTTKKRQALENAYLAASSEPDPVKRMASISGLNEVSRRSLTTRFGIQTFGQTNVRGAINNNIQNEARRTYTARRTRWDAQRAAFIATTADPAALAIWEANNPPPTDPFAPRP